MKRVVFIAVAMLASMNVNAQLRVLSDGSSVSSSLTVNGIMGRGEQTGAMTVESDEVLPTWNSLSGDEPVVLSVKTSTIGVTPLSIYYSGTKVFSVNYAGNATGRGFITTSDSICKTNIEKLQSPLQKLRTIHGVSFKYKEEGQARMHTTEKSLGATPKISAQIEEEQNRKRIGLIAQNVEEVFPEAVRTQYDGTKGILYSDLVGVLIEAINELQDSLSIQGTQISTLQNQVNAMQAIVFANNGTIAQPQTGTSFGNNLSEAVLYQNTPNPFRNETSISYRLPLDIQNAAICIYNLNGQQLKKYDLDASIIANSVTIDGSSLSAGMYIYALIIDGQMVASKRMVLTE